MIVLITPPTTDLGSRAHALRLTYSTVLCVDLVGGKRVDWRRWFTPCNRIFRTGERSLGDKRETLSPSKPAAMMAAMIVATPSLLINGPIYRPTAMRAANGVAMMANAETYSKLKSL